VIPPHPFGFAECQPSGICGVPPYRVICAPDGWFLDRGFDFDNRYQWPERLVNSLRDAQAACSQ
jgi:hypothetical protein